MRQHVSSVAQDIVMAVWRLDHVTNSGRSAGSTVRHDAKLTADSLSQAGNAETERAAARNKPSQGASVRQHASSVAQDIVMAVWRLGHVTNSGRSAGSTVRHDAKLTADSLSQAGKALRLSKLQHAAGCNKPPSWGASVRQHASSVAQDIVMAVW